MKVINETVLNIEVRGDDVAHLKSAVKKIAEAKNVIGFAKGGLSDGEADVMKRLQDEFSSPKFNG